jgi:molybdopterin-containing oxidoreductase family iron-sulfur binding subunit
MSMNRVDEYRRKFVATLGGAAAVVASGFVLREAGAAGAVSTRPTDQPVTNARRWGMLVDVTKLTDGGEAMVAACKKEHGWGNEEHSADAQKAHWMRVVKVTDKMTKNSFSLPVMCQHCENPPCVDVCPTGASMRRADGIVQVNKHICIGCRYCMMACPYKARSFVHEALTDQRPYSPRGMGTVESCNMCVHRIDEGRLPACVEAAPDAVIFGDLNDPNSEVSKALQAIGGKQIRADLNLNTGVRYHGI